MRQYEIHRLSADKDWGRIPVLPIDNTYFQTPDSIRAQAQIAYDDTAIHVHLSTVESPIRALEKGPLGSPCEDSCLEFFFCPMEGDGRYFNVEFNSNGCIYLGIGTSVVDLVRLVHADGGDFFPPDIRMTADGWEIFYSIPYEFIRRFFPTFSVFDGKRIRANCYKCADFSEPPHYMAWSPIVGEPFRFHRTECFGEMIFCE